MENEVTGDDLEVIGNTVGDSITVEKNTVVDDRIEVEDNVVAGDIQVVQNRTAVDSGGSNSHIQVEDNVVTGDIEVVQNSAEGPFDIEGNDVGEGILVEQNTSKNAAGASLVIEVIDNDPVGVDLICKENDPVPTENNNVVSGVLDCSS